MNIVSNTFGTLSTYTNILSVVTVNMGEMKRRIAGYNLSLTDALLTVHGN